LQVDWKRKKVTRRWDAKTKTRSLFIWNACLVNVCKTGKKTNLAFDFKQEGGKKKKN